MHYYVLSHKQYSKSEHNHFLVLFYSIESLQVRAVRRRKRKGQGSGKQHKQRKGGRGGEMKANTQGTEITKKGLMRRLTQRGNVREQNSSEGNPQQTLLHCRYILVPSQFKHSDWGNLIMPFMSTRRNMFGQNRNRWDSKECFFFF